MQIERLNEMSLPSGKTEWYAARSLIVNVILDDATAEIAIDRMLALEVPAVLAVIEEWRFYSLNAAFGPFGRPESNPDFNVARIWLEARSKGKEIQAPSLVALAEKQSKTVSQIATDLDAERRRLESVVATIEQQTAEYQLQVRTFAKDRKHLELEALWRRMVEEATQAKVAYVKSRQRSN